jgi:hypothetical protein
LIGARFSLKTLKDFSLDISDLETVSLAYDDPRIKLQITYQLVVQQLSQNGTVLYIDVDAQFSALLCNLPKDRINSLPPAYLKVITPDDPLAIFDYVLTMPAGKGMVLIDTLNTMQRMLLRVPSKTDAKTASHRLAVIMSALEETCRSVGKTILILNLTRSRPKEDYDGLKWERDIVGGRVSRFKSDLIIRARENALPEKNFREIGLQVEAIQSDRFAGNQEGTYKIPIDDSLFSIHP